MKIKIKYLVLILLGISNLLISQNETAKWYFGASAGLDFMTTPPSILTNGAMITPEGCASTADANGNLLFYTDGQTIWNQNHVIMANGAGLWGSYGACQSALVLKKIGSANEYVVFTNFYNSGIHYSIVDMSLAAGVGSVTVKNATPFFPVFATTERMTGIKHCNGIDYWIVTHDQNSNDFRSFLLTSAGVSTLSIVSSVGTIQSGGGVYQGYMKISPNGKKLGMALSNAGGGFELYDFDTSTGIVSNPITLLSGIGGYGCEFSPNGTKFYGSAYFSNVIYQWNICGVSANIIASQYTIAAGIIPAAMQLAKDGKIYVASVANSTLGVIQSPNSQGAACNYLSAGQSLFPQGSNSSLPNFACDLFQPLPTALSYSSSMALSCNTASFTSPPQIAAANALCASAGSSVNAIVWSFGDPASGPANTSTLSNPVHVYPGTGSYTAQLIIYYQCRLDTVKQLVNITSPTLSVLSSSASCNSLSSATVSTVGGSGPYSYTWSPGSQTTAAVSNLSAGSYTISMLDNGGGCTGTVLASVSSSLITGAVSSQSLFCNGIPSGTAVVNITNGSGSYAYSWSGTALTSSAVTGLAAGSHTVNVNDLVNNCSISNTFVLTQPPALTLNISVSSVSACVGNSIILSGTNSGGTGAYAYSWSGGPTTNTNAVTQGSGGNYTYSLSSTDANSCTVSNTVSVTYVNNPALTLSNVSICPLQSGTLTVSGASSYTWIPSNTVGSSYVQSPVGSTQYTVVGSALSCSSMATASIVVKAIPVPTLSSNSPLCNNQSLILSASGGTAFVWSGPLTFTSASSTNTINPANPNQSGVYSSTVTGLNSCTAAASVSVTVNPTPTLSVLGSSICSTQGMSLSAFSFAGSTYFWSGPNGFTSNLQFPVVAVSNASMSGSYTVKVSSVAGCTTNAVANVSITAAPNVSITANNPLCVGATLQFFVTGGVTYNWSGPNGFSSSIQSPSISAVSFTNAGTYTLVATTGPCMLTALKTITVNPLPSPTANYNAPLCENKILHLNVSGAATYTWVGPQTFNSSVQSPSLALVSFSNAGNYSVTATDVNGCVAGTFVFVNILPNPIASTNGASVCAGGNVTLSASGGLTYVWSGPLGFNSNSNPLYFSNINLAQSGNYSVVVTGSNSCSANTVANLGVFNYALPIPTIVATPSVCVYSNISLQASGGVIYNWTGPDGFVSTSNSISFVALHTGMSGIYTLAVTNSSFCVGTGTVFVKVFPLPSATLTSSKNELCIPFCSEFKVTPAIGSASLSSYQYFLEGKAFTDPQITYCIHQSGSSPAFVYFTDVHGCVNSSSVLVSGYPKPQADFEYYPSKPIAGVDLVKFTNRSTGAFLNNWTWVFVEDDSINSQQASFLFASAGQFPAMLIVKNDWFCADTIVKFVNVEEDFALYIPNTFTPNHDGLNDTFHTYGVGLKEFSIEIYDRWGIKVFATDDFHQSWDGQFKGEACEQGVYSWRIYCLSSGGKRIDRTGFVMLEK